MDAQVLAISTDASPTLEHWKKELLDFGFSMQDPVSELIAVETWDED